MHKLDRSSVAAPDCLLQYDARAQTWDDLTRDHDCKSQVRSSLAILQGTPGITMVEGASEFGIRCAYCESTILHEGHIEHFRRKNRNHFPEHTFAWPNLFLACGSSEHCGHYKDRRSALPYNPDDLIKPDEHDPEQFLYFHSSGSVLIREALADEDTFRASETIRVFGLNNGSLPGARARAVAKYRDIILDDLTEIASWSPSDLEEYLQTEIDATRWQPYSTTIKHFLQSGS